MYANLLKWFFEWMWMRCSYSTINLSTNFLFICTKWFMWQKASVSKGHKICFLCTNSVPKIYCISSLRPLEPHFISFLLILPTIFSSCLYGVHNKIFVFITKPTKYKLVVHQNPFEMWGHACLMTCYDISICQKGRLHRITMWLVCTYLNIFIKRVRRY